VLALGEFTPQKLRREGRAVGVAHAQMVGEDADALKHFPVRRAFDYQ
jgi:hypothetical protein